ncbi:MAG TPA: hypothetical protein DCQ50_04890 [Chryseobacterium sp.]|nr:hypothetical protein [Chryseobacterium sp.]
MIEDNRTEYKSLKKVVDASGKIDTKGLKDIAITCVSFANKHGGRIIIGFEDNLREPPPSQKIPPNLVTEIVTRLRHLCFSVSVFIDDNIETHNNGGEYFTIGVHPSLKSIATKSDGKIYVRVGDQCQPARSEDILNLAVEKDTFQWELQIRNYTLSDIPVENIRRFVTEIRSSDRVKDFVKQLSDTEILEHYNLTQKNNLTNLGVLWIGTSFQRSRLLYPITVQYIVYDQTEKKIRKFDWSDNSYNPKDLVLDIEKEAVELTYFHEFPQGMFRTKIRHYDERVLRELLINAFAHKSYTISGDIFIKVYSDRLEIINPGGLPLGITNNNILHSSYSRNPHLKRIFHDLKLMEGEGSGYNLMYEIASRDSKAFPIITSDYTTVSVTQFSGILDEDSLLILDFIAKNYILSQKELITLGVVSRNKKISATSLSKELQLTDVDRLRSYVSKLIDKAILISRGIRKGTEYLINPTLIANARLNIKTTLKVIEPHRLKALIEEDIRLNPYSKIVDIHKRLPDVFIKDVRKIVYLLVEKGILEHSGGKTYRTYSLKK